MEKAPAIAYLRTDVSGARQHRDECRMRGLSERLGYLLGKTLVLCAASHSRIDRLLALIAMERAEAVFVPHLDHLEGDHLRVVPYADVIVAADEVYARWPSITSLNQMIRGFGEERGDPEPPAAGSVGRDPEPPRCEQDRGLPWSEPPRSPKGGPDPVRPHLRALPPPRSDPPQPRTGEIGEWFPGR
ncbi:MAG: hypothetical protein HOQ36_01505 [Nocardia sp.]|nr:hypothetical protein [Nocardia sp.]